MVLLARSASLFPSRLPSLLAPVSRSGAWRAALHTHARPSGAYLLSRRSAPRLGPRGSQVTTRLLTTQREKVKVLLVLYDGGKHAEEVRRIFSIEPLLVHSLSLSFNAAGATHAQTASK